MRNPHSTAVPKVSLAKAVQYFLLISRYMPVRYNGLWWKFMTLQRESNVCLNGDGSNHKEALSVLDVKKK